MFIGSNLYYFHRFITLTVIIAIMMSNILKGKQNTDELIIKRGLDQIHKDLQKIPAQRRYEVLMDHELILDLVALVEIRTKEDPKETKEEQKEINKDGKSFEPKFPLPISEKDKGLSLYERIARKYKGELPNKIKCVIFYLNNLEKCSKINFPNRLLLHGNPGTGKSYLVEVLAEELQMPAFFYTASIFADKYIGESSRRIRKAFEIAKNLDRPVIIFVDELDALATKRKESTHEEHRATLMTLLTELQELKKYKKVFFIAATNDLKSLDPAITDRFSGAICEIKELNTQARAELFLKVFEDNGISIGTQLNDVIIDEALAKRLAEVTKPIQNHNNETDETDTKKSQSKNFSNRDIESIVTVALLKRELDCEENPEDCKQKKLTAYIRQAMDETGKKGSFAKFFSPNYSDGI